jgi:hypothetical protein
VTPAALHPSPRQGQPGSADAVGAPTAVRELRTGLPGRKTERFGMHPAVVLGQYLTGLTGPVGDGAAADPAACDRKMRNSNREVAET